MLSFRAAICRASVAATMSTSQALAHCYVGARFFPAMLATDDPASLMSCRYRRYSTSTARRRQAKVHIVGSDSSSATQGSSVASIAGKNRAPT